MKYIEVKTEDDKDILENLVQEIWPETYLDIIGKEKVDYMMENFQTRRNIDEEMDSGVTYFLLEDAGQILGYFAYQFDEDQLYIRKLYLSKEARGRGYASKIFRDLEGIAREHGKEYLFLHVNAGNKRAFEIYKSRGFEVIADVDAPFGDIHLNDYHMKKAL
jgi:Acetyltransferases